MPGSSAAKMTLPVCQLKWTTLFPVRQNSAPREKLENLQETWIWPRLAKGRPPIDLAASGGVEKSCRILAATFGILLTVTALYAWTHQDGHATILGYMSAGKFGAL
jgi:hypothetical protein